VVTKRARIALASVTIVLAAMAAIPAQSMAVWDQYFCGIVRAPGEVCYSSGSHSLYMSRSWYPGAPAHHVKTCTYLYNNRTTAVRGGVIDCGWSDVPNNNTGYVNFGQTSAADYNARVYNHFDTCCAHTVNGYTSTWF
jgi:hypothetical protein